MLSDDAVEDGACLARNSLKHSGLEDIQMILIGKHALLYQVIPVYTLVLWGISIADSITKTIGCYIVTFK